MTVPHPNLALMRGVPTNFLDENFAALDGALGSTVNNLLLNGDLRFWRENGTNVSVPAGSFVFGPDMIAGQCIGSSLTLQRGVSGLGLYAGQPKYYMVASSTSVAGANNFARLLFQFEDVRSFAGQTLTFAFKSSCAADGQIAIGMRQWFGTGGGESAEVGTYVGTVNLTAANGVEEQSVTFTVPAINGKAIGANDDSGFSIVLWFDAGANLNAFTNSLGQHTFSANLWDFRLNFGSLSIARNSSHDINARYLSLCRYFHKSFYHDTTPASNIGLGTGEMLFAQIAAAGGGQQEHLRFPVQMYKTPNMGLYSVDAVGNTIRTTGVGNWGAVAAFPNLNGCTFSGTTPGGSVPAQSCVYHYVANSTLVF